MISFRNTYVHEIEKFVQFYMSSKAALRVDIIVHLITEASIIILVLSSPP
jgi:hypothetical protein